MTQGPLEVVSPERHRVGVLREGDYFGDLSMLLNEKRTGSVRALTFSETFSLSERDFGAIRDTDAEFRDVLMRVSSERSDMSSDLLLEGVLL